MNKHSAYWIVIATTLLAGVLSGCDKSPAQREKAHPLVIAAGEELARNGRIVAESNLPLLEAVWVETAFSNEVHVRFSEACDHMDDILGLTLYTVRDSGGTGKGYPVSATPHADGMGVVRHDGNRITLVRNHELRETTGAIAGPEQAYDITNGGTTTLVFEAEGAPFGGATVAVQSGDSIYLGAFDGDRLGRIAAPVAGDEG